MEGFEPPRANAHCALNAARLPVPPHRHLYHLTVAILPSFGWFVKIKGVSFDAGHLAGVDIPMRKGVETIRGFV